MTFRGVICIDYVMDGGSEVVFVMAGCSLPATRSRREDGQHRQMCCQRTPLPSHPPPRPTPIPPPGVTILPPPLLLLPILLAVLLSSWGNVRHCVRLSMVRSATALLFFFFFFAAHNPLLPLMTGSQEFDHCCRNNYRLVHAGLCYKI